MLLMRSAVEIPAIVKVSIGAVAPAVGVPADFVATARIIVAVIMVARSRAVLRRGGVRRIPSAARVLNRSLPHQISSDPRATVLRPEGPENGAFWKRLAVLLKGAGIRLR